MKVSDAIKHLQAYDDDEELIMAWWDKESFSISDEDWDKLANYVSRKMDWSRAHEDLEMMFTIAKEVLK
tara:strand:- start:629 stop:835 length:207 start_codon:yes stop_codon:yes gene_type:complete